MGMMKVFFAAALAIAAAVAGPAQAAFERKVALVVGIGAYENAPALKNPVGDARAMAASLKRLGFETVEGYDLDRRGLQDAVRDFASASRNAELTTFFYAGHGIAYEGRNFLIPVDARFEDATALDFEAVPVDVITKQMRYADAVSLVFLDACRDNPLAETLARSLGFSTRSASVARGLASMDVTQAGRGLAIAFATSPGQVAYDGAGEHSPFTSALLEHIEAKDTDITEVMSRVTGDVLRLTDERQRPWLNVSLTGPVVLNPAEEVPSSVKTVGFGPGVVGDPSSAASVTGTNDDLEAQTLLFNLARETGARSDYEAYLKRFPDGLYAYNARQAIAALDRADAPETTVAAAEATALARGREQAEEPVAGLDFSQPRPSANGTDKAADDGTLPPDEAMDVIAKEGDTLAVIVPEQVEPPQATEADEQALGLDRSARRAIQHRLNLADTDVGPADGIFGPMTRAGIKAWQAKSGLVVTGYLNRAQLTKLEQATQTRYAALVEEQRAAAERRRAAAAASRERQRAARAAATRSAGPKRTTRRQAAAPTRRSAPKRTVRRSAPAPQRPQQRKPSRAENPWWGPREVLSPRAMQQAAEAARRAGY